MFCKNDGETVHHLPETSHKCTTFLKGSYDVAKKNNIWCIWCNALCLCGLRLKNTLFSTYCTLLLLRISETRVFARVVRLQLRMNRVLSSAGVDVNVVTVSVNWFKSLELTQCFDAGFGWNASE